MSRSLLLVLLVGLTACGTTRPADAGAQHGAAPHQTRITEHSGLQATSTDTIPGGAHSSRREQIGFTGGNSTARYRLQFPGGAERGTLHLTIRTDGGVVRWALTDPAGGVRWSGMQGAGSSVDVERPVDGPAGVWTLAITLEHADGRYTLDWQAR